MAQALSKKDLELSLTTTLSRVSCEGRLFIFAYGSLLWRPDFEYSTKSIAKIEGYHRSFCHLSPHGRGSLELPGLVLGLEPGGNCAGLVYELTVDDHYDELLKLWHRELRTGSYVPRKLTATLPTARSQVSCLAFTANQNHDQYVKSPTHDKLLTILQTAKGFYGSNLEYVAKTISSLRELEICDPELEKVAADLGL